MPYSKGQTRGKPHTHTVDLLQIELKLQTPNLEKHFFSFQSSFPAVIFLSLTSIYIHTDPKASSSPITKKILVRGQNQYSIDNARKIMQTVLEGR